MHPVKYWGNYFALIFSWSVNQKSNISNKALIKKTPTKTGVFLPQVQIG